MIRAWFCVLAMLAAMWPAAAAAQARRALVIGNAAYTADNALANSVNDARDMTSTLKELGFDVVSVYDGNLESMHLGLLRFARSVQPGDVALVFYAGHGVQGPAAQGASTDNYLVPVDAQPESDERLSVEALALSEVIDRLNQSRASSKIVIMDACRNNPFARSWTRGRRGGAVRQGLSAPNVAGAVGTYLAFATSPDSTAADYGGDGRNGLYTSELLKALAQPGWTASQVFETVSERVAEESGGAQVPWNNSTGRVGGMVFRASLTAPSPVFTAAPAPAPARVAPPAGGLPTAVRELAPEPAAAVTVTAAAASLPTVPVPAPTPTPTPAPELIVEKPAAAATASASLPVVSSVAAPDASDKDAMLNETIRAHNAAIIAGNEAKKAEFAAAQLKYEEEVKSRQRTYDAARASYEAEVERVKQKNAEDQARWKKAHDACLAGDVASCAPAGSPAGG